MRRALALGLALGVLAPSSAHAFCRTTTVPVQADFSPSSTRCWDQGVPLFWLNSCVSYSVQQGASRQVAYDDAANAFSRAFTKWTGASCPTDGSGRSRVSIDVRDLGPVECATVDYQTSGGNQNLIVFQDDKWPHNDSANTLALTTVTFNPETGEIYDADMEINATQGNLSVGDPVPANGFDLQSVITHEAGHFYGLAHATASTSTMYAAYKAGTSTLRSLSADDIEGMCAIYPSASERSATSGLVAAARCGGGDNGNEEGGCSAAGSSSSTAWLVPLFALASGVVGRRRRRL